MFLILAALPLATALTNCEKFSRPSAAKVKMENPDQSFEDAFFKKASRSHPHTPSSAGGR